MWFALIFFGAGVAFGRISKGISERKLNGHNDMDICSCGSTNVCDSVMGDDLK